MKGLLWLRDVEAWGIPALASADDSKDDVICWCAAADPDDGADDDDDDLDLDDWIRSSFAATSSAWATSCQLLINEKVLMSIYKYYFLLITY